MLIYTFLLLAIVPLVFVHGAYEPRIKRLSFHSQNPNDVKVGAITLKDGKTAIFVYDGNDFWGYLTSDFRDYELDTCEVDHVLYDGDDDNTLVPCFVAYDPNTSGFGDDYLIGASFAGVNFIASLYGDIHGNTYKYCENCIDSRVLFDVSVSWDSQNNYWVGQVQDSSNVVTCATSPNLQTWQTQQWQVPITSALLEIFPIADADDQYDSITWIIVYKSEPDSYGKTKLLYGTYTHGNSDQPFKEIGVLDCSNNWVDFSIVNDNSTDLRNRKCLATLSSEPSTTSDSNAYVSCRTLTYSGGKLRQVPIPTWLGPSNDRSVVDLGPQTVSPGQDPLSNVTVASQYQIDAKYTPNGGSCSFKLKVNPNNASQCAGSVTVNDSAITVETYSWQNTDGYPGVETIIYSIVISYNSTGGEVSVTINVQEDIIEYFVDDGLYVGSVQVSTDTDTTWDRCKLSTSTETQFSKLACTSSVEKGTTTVGGTDSDYTTGGVVVDGGYTTSDSGVVVGDEYTTSDSGVVVGDGYTTSDSGVVVGDGYTTSDSGLVVGDGYTTSDSGVVVDGGYTTGGGRDYTNGDEGDYTNGGEGDYTNGGEGDYTTYSDEIYPE